MITTATPETWQDLQEDVAQILKQCGFAVEVEKTIKTARGTATIDVFAQEEVQGRQFTTLCECKFWNKAVPQHVIHSFRTVVGDIGANKGYIISTAGFQSGAISAAELTNIELVTWQQFQIAFEQSWLTNFFSPVLLKALGGLMTLAEGFGPAWLPNFSKPDQQKYWTLQEKHAELGWLLQHLAMHPVTLAKQPYPTLPLSKSLSGKYNMKEIPPEIANTLGYQQALDAALAVGASVFAELDKMQAKAERNARRSPQS